MLGNCNLNITYIARRKTKIVLLFSRLLQFVAGAKLKLTFRQSSPCG